VKEKSQKNRCPKCGKEFKLSKRDRTLRRLVALNAKLFPALEIACEEAKDYCNECWKAHVKPVAEKIAGIKNESA